MYALFSGKANREKRECIQDYRAEITALPIFSLTPIMVLAACPCSGLLAHYVADEAGIQ